VVVQVLLQLGAERPRDLGPDRRVVELVLRLPLKLGVHVKQVHDAHEALSGVVALNLQAVGHQVVRVHERPDHGPDAALEALLVGPAVLRRDAVDERMELLLRRVGPLKGNLQAPVPVQVVVLHHEDIVVDRAHLKVLHQVVQVFLNAPFVVQLVPLVARLVPEDNF